MRTVIAALIAVVVSQAPALAQTTAWKPYVDREYGFVLDYPGDPVIQNEQTTTARGLAPTRHASVDQGDIAFSISAGDYSKLDGGLPADAAGVIKSAIDGMAEGKKVISRSTFAVSGGAGGDAIVSGGGMVIRARAYYLAPHILIVLAGEPESADPAKLRAGDFQRFFDSFAMLVK